MLKALVELCQRYPAWSAAVAASVVVFLAAKLGIVVDRQSATDAALSVLPILLAGHLTHRAVVPVASLVTDHRMLPPDPVNRPPGEVSP